MAVKNLDEYSFPPLYELNASPLGKCIHFTKKGSRCQWPLNEKDQEEAQTLRDEIVAASDEDVELELLQEYAKYNCCGRKAGGHQNILQDKGFLEPLAIRWQKETRQRRSKQGFNPSTDSHKSADSVDLSSTTTDIGPQCKLRPRTTADSTADRTNAVPKKPQTEFRPHITEPDPDETVLFKILSPLKDRDFELGKLYIYKRESSPGYVKIGWTARSIQRRLDDWAKCGYTPELLFSACDVPNAQRVETLTHFELMKEWRVERICKAPWCRKSHREWFEIDEERAKQVLGDWADLFKSVRPYDSRGELKPEWAHTVNTINEGGELVTAKRLLEISRESPTKALLPDATEHSFVEVSAPLVKLLNEKPVVLEDLPTTPKEGAANNGLTSKCLPVRLKEMAITSSNPPFSQAMKQDSTPVALPRNLGELASKSLPKETLSEQSESTAEILSATTKLFTVNSNSTSELSPPRSLPSSTVPLLKPQSSGESTSDFKSLSLRETPLKAITIVNPRRIVITRAPSLKNAPGEEEDLGSVTIPSDDKLLPQLIPLPPSPPPSP